jgi:hypothetical protein
MTNSATSLVGVLSFLVLMLPILGGLLHGWERAKTNSGLTTPEPALSFDYPRELTRWLGESAPLKQTAIRIDSWVDRAVFGEQASAGTSSSRVIDGRSGFMFIADAFTEACNPHSSPQAMSISMQKLKSIVEGSGRQFRLVVSPDKSTVLDQFLPDDFALRECFQNFNQDFWARFNAEDFDGFVDLRTELRIEGAERREILYKRRDTHWNDAGAAVASRAVVESVVAGIWEDGALRFQGQIEYNGDLNVLAGETQVDLSPSYVLMRSDAASVSTEMIDEAAHGRNRRVINNSPNIEMIEGRTIVFGDSFSEIAEAFYLQYFEDVTLMRLDDFTPEKYADLIVASDRVILWSVERSFPYRVAYQWGSTEFLDSLEQKLK